MKSATKDRYSLFLLLSLLGFALLSPFLEDYRFGRFILAFSMYVMLVTATLQIHENRRFRLLAAILAVPSTLVSLAGLIHPDHKLLLANFVLLMIFFGIVSVALFAYLGQPGPVTNGRLYASASLYLMLGTFWFTLYTLTEEFHPGSFVQSGAAVSTVVQHSGLLYFSLITLTTVGYGDIIPVSPLARMFAAIEALTGVLYIAITLARLVASYQRTEMEQNEHSMK
jgi:hypothetical protein